MPQVGAFFVSRTLLECNKFVKRRASQLIGELIKAMIPDFPPVDLGEASRFNFGQMTRIIRAIQWQVADDEAQ